MNAPQGPAAPASGFDDLPDLAALMADPEIAALLDFEPVPRRARKQKGWSAEMQRLFIARLAVHGSPGKACDELGMYRSGIDKVYKSAGAESFRDAWAGAVELAERRRASKVAAGHANVAGLTMPFVDNRRKHPPAAGNGGPLPGQVPNEYGEWEDEDSIQRRADDARDGISNRLLQSRRLFLAGISGCPAQRAAFEILTDYPVDWDKARAFEPQADEPWRKPNMRDRDMLLTAEGGWFGAELVHGPDHKAELLRAVNAHRVEEGQEPVDWGESAED